MEEINATIAKVKAKFIKKEQKARKTVNLFMAIVK